MDGQPRTPNSEHGGASPVEPLYRVPAAEKALDVLEFMARSNEGRTQTEIAVGVGRSIHEVYRIIQLLERRGYISRAAAADRYVLSLKVFALAHQSPPLATLTAAAVEPMRRLAEAARQSCHLAVLSDLEIVVVAQVNSPQPMFYGVTLGARFPVQETSSGLVLMAGLTDAARERLLAAIARQASCADATAGIRENLQPVLRDGFDVRPSMMVPGVVNLSFPVRNHMAATVAALTLPFLPVRHETPSLDVARTETAAAASAISTVLGFGASAAAH